MARPKRGAAAAAESTQAAHDEALEDDQSSPTPEAEEDGANDEPEARQGLRFNETLLGRPGKQIKVEELVRRLSALGQELSAMDQEEITEETLAALTPIGKQLSDVQLVAHKDIGVRAWVAWCAVDLLRLCAPNAPFSPKQSKAIFEMIIKSLFTSLGDPSHAYYQQCLYVLKSLADVKSIVLITDLPGSEALILQIFMIFFDTLSGLTKTGTVQQIPKAAHYHMTALLVVLVDEVQSLPSKAADLLIAQFLRVDPNHKSAGDKTKKAKAEPDQSTLSLKEYPPSYSAAKTICSMCPEKMSQEISRYFNDVILAISQMGDDRDGFELEDFDVSMANADEDQLNELVKAHNLLKEVWKACPSVLPNVIPQLEHELSTENVQLRVLATETLGDIVSGIGVAGPPTPPTVDPAAYPPLDIASSDNSKSENWLTKPASPQSFPQSHPKAYAAFLSRKQDKSYLVRSAWATAIGRILATNAGGIGLSREEEQQLVEDLARMLNDGDEKVRLAAVKAISGFSLKELVNKFAESGGVDKTGSVLNNLSQRIKDKKPHIRLEAMQLLASMWASAHGEIAAGNERVIELLSGIPSKILNCYYTGDPEIVVLMDKVLYNTLLPLHYPPIKSKTTKANGASQTANGNSKGATGPDGNLDPDKIRADRILLLAKYLDDRARTVFLALPKRQRSVANCMRAYLDWSEKYNGGVMDTNADTIQEMLRKIILETTKLLPDPIKVKADLQSFAKKHDRRAYQLMRFCCDATSNYKTVHNAIKEFLKRVDDSFKETLTPLLYRMAILVFNRSHVPTFLDQSKSANNTIPDIVHGMMNSISQSMPIVASTQVNELFERIIEHRPRSAQQSSSEAANDLRICANFAKQMPDKMPRGTALDDAIKAYIQHGVPSEAGKYAVAIGMAQAENRNNTGRVLQEYATAGFKYGQPGFLSRLAALSQLALLSPSSKGSATGLLEEIALKQTLRAKPITKGLITEGYLWSEKVDDDATAKCWAIRVLTNRIRSHADPESLPQNANPILEVLVDLVEREGDVDGLGQTSAVGKPRIRLQAAKSLLKLCKIRSVENIFTAQQFQKLAEIALDPVFEVRRAFLTKLERYFNQGLLPPRFYTIFFLVAYEPNTAFKSEVVKWIRSRASLFASQKSTVKDNDNHMARKSTTLETVVQRLLSFLAHFSDYGDSPTELAELSVYIVFYLAAVANAENISFIYHIAQRVKASKDVVGGSNDEVGVDFTDRLRVLSDLASYTIRAYIDMHGWTLQSLPGRAPLSTQLFKVITNNLDVSDITAKNYLPEEAEALVDNVVQWSKRKAGQGILSLPQVFSKKRKSEADIIEHSAKKVRASALPVREKSTARSKKSSRRKTRGSDDDDDAEEDDDDNGDPRSTPIDDTNRRKSGRASIVQAKKSYRERDDSEDDAEMEQANDYTAENIDNEEDKSSDIEMANDEESEVAQAVDTSSPPPLPSSPGPSRNSRRQKANASTPATFTDKSSTKKKTPTTSTANASKGRRAIETPADAAPVSSSPADAVPTSAARRRGRSAKN